MGSGKIHQGYWFSGDKLRDGRPIPKIGTWLRHKGPLVPCESGLHWSACPFDALQYAPGPLLHRVECRGKTIPHGNPIDKFCSRERRIVATIDATYLLRRFAADQALGVAHLWSMPQIVRKYLESLDEAKRDAARDAAWAAARAAALDAARAAARQEFVRRVDAALADTGGA